VPPHQRVDRTWVPLTHKDTDLNADRRTWDSIRSSRSDQEISPHTGLTRSHWESAADLILDGAWTYHIGGLILPPGRPSLSGARSDGLEGFARTFLLAAFRIRGSNGVGVERLVDRYISAIQTGSNQADDRHGWPRLNETPQAVVEAASIAIALQLTKSWIWDQLDEPCTERLCSWLEPGLVRPPVNNNWNLFPLVIAGFLESIGHGSSSTAAAINRALEIIEPWYDGEGWYSDGPGRAYDHYNSWAMHFYPVLYAYLSDNGELLDRYGPRLSRFLESYALLFDANGAPVFIGRSLTYRFAVAASLWLGRMTGYSPLEPGTTRRIASGTLKYFLDGGVLDSGMLSLGWLQAGDMPVQRYSGPASPNWSAKAFIGLLIPPQSLEWQSKELPAPIERGDFCTPIGRTGLLAQGTTLDGIVRLHNHGSDTHKHRNRTESLDDPLYSQVAYSTRTVPTWIPPHCNTFGLIVRGNQTMRGPISPLGVGEDWAASRQVPQRRRGLLAMRRLDLARIRSILPAVRPLNGAAIDYAVCCHAGLELRIWRVCGASGRVFQVSGWPIPGATRSQIFASFQNSDGLVSAEITSSGMNTGLYGRLGFASSSTLIEDQLSPYGQCTGIPVLTGRCRGDQALFAAVAWLSDIGSSVDPSGIQIEDDDGTITARWNDGFSHQVIFSDSESMPISVRSQNRP
jgi:hypothetical protein